MQYDIAEKILLELAKEDVLQNFLNIEISSAELIDELPRETMRAKRDDYSIRVRQKSGEDIIVVLELQTKWVKEKCLDLLDYYIDFQRKYKLPVKPCMLLFTKSSVATNIYEDRYVTFKFNLIKMWTIPAVKYLSEEFINLWPFVPLMEDGLKYVDKIEKEIYQSNIGRQEKVDLLTVLTIFTGLRDEGLCAKLIKRRRDIMIESPAYDLIEKEGALRNALETAKKLLEEEKMSLESVLRITELTKEDLEKEGLI